MASSVLSHHKSDGQRAPPAELGNRSEHPRTATTPTGRSCRKEEESTRPAPPTRRNREAERCTPRASSFRPGQNSALGDILCFFSRNIQTMERASIMCHGLDHRCTGCHGTNRTTWPRLQSLSGFQVGPCEEEEGNGQQRPPVFYLDIFSRKRQGEGAAGITTQIPILLKCHVP